VSPLQDLWGEVLGLLVEDKEALPAGTVMQKARMNNYRSSSSSGAFAAVRLQPRSVLLMQKAQMGS
jgi:hypothetical protein